MHQALDFWYCFCEATTHAILTNYVVNPSGRYGRWHARDLLQEHHNKKIKYLFNGDKHKSFDSSYVGETVSLNIVELKNSTDTWFKKLGLANIHPGRSSADIRADINFLAHLFDTERHLSFTPGRRQTFLTKDAFEAGITKLADGALDSFLKRTFRV